MKNPNEADLARDVVTRLDRPGFFKRLLVMVYDGLLLLGVIFMAVMIFLIVTSPFASSVDPTILRTIKAIYLSGVSFMFFGWFWTHGGQTLGMRVWHLHLVDEYGKYLTWPLAAKRFLLAIVSWLPLGLGYTWVLLSQKRNTWHDYLCKTNVVRVPPKK